MKDRVPAYPGRVKLNPVDGQDGVYDMLRADEPIQDGTPLNKATLLTDETAARFGLSDDATVNDALANAQRNFPVGTIVGSARPDVSDLLGGEWALCNGANIYATEYPELAVFLQKDGYQTAEVAGILLQDVACYNGTWVAVGYAAATGGHPYILISTDPAGTWTVNQISTSLAYLYAVDFYNGTWVAVGNITSGYPCIFTTTDPTGEWTRQQISSTSHSLQDVACYNGTWVAVGYDSSSGQPCCFTTTDPTGTWTGGGIHPTAANLTGIACYEGTWVACSGNGSSYPAIMYTTDPTGSWTYKQLSTNTSDRLTGMACYDGTWVIAGHVGSASPIFYTTTDPTGTWTRKTVPTTTTVAIYDVACCDGKWRAVGYDSTNGRPRMFETTDPTGGWTSTQLDGAGIFLYGVFCYDGIWTMVGSASTVYASTLRALPVISLSDDTFAYIKLRDAANLSGGASGGGSNTIAAVLYTEQTLTEEQKAQARENIGAAAKGESDSGEGASGLPAVTEEDNDKILQVVDGAWAVVSLADSAVKTYIDAYISEALGGEY